MIFIFVRKLEGKEVLLNPWLNEGNPKLKFQTKQSLTKLKASETRNYLSTQLFREINHHCLYLSQILNKNQFVEVYNEMS